MAGEAVTMNHQQPHHQLIDGFNRKVNYLRISVTDRCNLKCRYCVPTLPMRMAADKLMTWQEMYCLVRIASTIGINKVRLTGGEPLCRTGIVDFISRLADLSELKDISITTNGTLLSRHCKQLAQAGVRRINISLDTLDPEKFSCLTGSDQFDTVWRGIQDAAATGFDPIKINMVVMKGFNDDEIEAMAKLTMDYPFHIRFIEYMPIGTDPLEACHYFLPSDEIKRRISRIAPIVAIENGPMDGPARRFRFAEAKGEIGLIGSMSAHFCETCNRLRLTADGRLRPCLLNDGSYDLLALLRDKASDHALANRFIETILKKEDRHRLGFTRDKVLETKMMSIGG